MSVMQVGKVGNQEVFMIQFDQGTFPTPREYDRRYRHAIGKWPSILVAVLIRRVDQRAFMRVWKATEYAKWLKESGAYQNEDWMLLGAPPQYSAATIQFMNADLAMRFKLAFVGV